MVHARATTASALKSTSSTVTDRLAAPVNGTDNRVMITEPASCLHVNLVHSPSTFARPEKLRCLDCYATFSWRKYQWVIDEVG